MLRECRCEMKRNYKCDNPPGFQQKQKKRSRVCTVRQRGEKAQRFKKCKTTTGWKCSNTVAMQSWRVNTEKKYPNHLSSKCKRGKFIMVLSYIHHMHRLLSLSGAKWSALIPLGVSTKKALLEKLMLSSVLLSSILSTTIHTGLQRNVWGWQPEIIACVCESGNTSIPRSTYWAQLRLCCRASSLRRLRRIVWATCRNRQWTLAPAWES